MSSASWESGFQPLEPLRLQKLRHSLTRLDHPKFRWELRLLESNPPPPSEDLLFQRQPTWGELGALVVGILRFLLASSVALTKVFLQKKGFLKALPARDDHQPETREF